MKFKGDVMRSAAAALFAVLVLASCGGGTQVDAFAPNRVLAFGDEYSVIDDSAEPGNGRKYTVNAIDYDTTDPSNPVPTVPTSWNCGVNPNWVQYMAGSYNLVFPECQGSYPSQQNHIYAKPHARVADLAGQIDDFLLSSDTFSEKDLVTVMIGTNDVKAIYEQAKADSSIDVIATMGQAGTDVGTQIVRLTDLGAKVLVATIPDVGYTPYAVAENNGDLLSKMSKEFNSQLRLSLEKKVRNGGRSVGLVLADDMLLTMVRNPVSYNLTNLSEAACLSSAPLPNCNPLTLQTSTGYTGTLPETLPATASSWLWADDTFLGPVGQTQIGALAVTRAHNNPF